MFAHPVMLAGIGGAVLPVVLHLLNRARFRNVRWGAMIFITGSDPDARDSLARWRVPMMLILRMAIVALLAMAVAHPLLHQAADSRLCVVVLFDNGPGMGFDEGTAGTRIESARVVALSIVKQLQRDDEVRVIPLAGEQNNSDATDLQSAVSQIADIRLSTNRADIADGLTNAAKILARSDVARKSIILIADREAVSWRGLTDIAAATFRQRMLPYGNNLRLLFVPIGSESSENVAIDRIVLPPSPLMQGESIAAQVVVHNYGSSPVTHFPIEMRVVGLRSEERTAIDLPAGGVVNVAFPLAAASPGYYIVVARVGNDATIAGGVHFDDQAEAIAHRIGPVPVLILADPDLPTQANPAPTSAAIDQVNIIASALAPFSRSGLEGIDPANPTLVSSALSLDQFLAQHDVAIWCARRSPTPIETEQLKAFVVNGGGLFLFPSGGETTAINSLFEMNDGLSPVSLHSASTTQTTSSPTTRRTTLTVTPFFRRQQLISAEQAKRCVEGIKLEDLAPIDRSSSAAQVLFQTTDGHPWLIGKTFGKGRVLIATGSADDHCGNFTECPAFVQLMRETIRWLAVGKADRLNLNAGESFELRSVPASSTNAVVTFPDETHQQVTIVRESELPAVRFFNTSLAGRYQIEFDSSTGKQTIPFQVRPTLDASDLTPLSSQRLNRIEQILNVLPVTTDASAEIVARLDRDMPTDLWLPLLLGVSGLLLLEWWLSNRFSANRRSEGRF